MRKWWYQRILVIILVLAMTMGTGFGVQQLEASEEKQIVSSKGSNAQYVIPGGMAIGIYMETDGVLVLSTDCIECIDGNEYEPAKNLVKAGDYIIGMNGEKIENKRQLVQAVNKLENSEVILEIRRDEECIKIKMQSVEVKNDQYKLGIWVKDSVQGLGTLTYLTMDGKFGALGHGIHDSETNELIEIEKGSVYNTNIIGIQKGQKGEPGGLEGVIIYRSSNKLGVISENTEDGIYGSINKIETLCGDIEPVEICKKEDIRLGKATILCCVNGMVEEYDIKIKNIDSYAKDANKGIIIEVTDKKLLELTGGIVQGMSGSPILQDGKIVGAITHVLVNDPTRGYGIFIEDMIKQ
ncbi:MAG: SpoIVB peptidase [Tyzzerella sp.]|nr:SpoIVB peptidase [Tyzzerella sp.]